MIELTDEVLGAYLDGALPAAQRDAVAHALAAAPDCAARLESMRAADQTMRRAHAAPITRLDDPVARKIRDARLATQARRTARLPTVATLSALAAGLVGLVIGQVLPTRPFDTPHPDFAATGALARALETRPSGEAGGDVRILLSFKTAQATPCRQFAATTPGQTGEGVACREDATWRVVAWVQSPDGAGADYHAAGADGVIDEVVDRIDTTGALSLADERALLQARWR